MREVTYTRLEDGSHQFTTARGTCFTDYSKRGQELREDERERLTLGVLWVEWHQDLRDELEPPTREEWAEMSQRLNALITLMDMGNERGKMYLVRDSRVQLAVNIRLTEQERREEIGRLFEQLKAYRAGMEVVDLEGAKNDQ